GIVYTQLGIFKAQKSISYHKDALQTNQKGGLWTKFRNVLANRIQIYTLVCGNSLVTGEHGFVFTHDFDDRLKLVLIDRILHSLVRILRKRGIRVRLLFAKDFMEPVTS